MAPQPHPVDRHVGGRIRLRRVLLGLSQERLAKPLGISFQQLQKYESGLNRVSASRLFDAACLLGLPVLWFFQEMPTDTPLPAPIRPGFPDAAWSPSDIRGDAP